MAKIVTQQGDDGSTRFAGKRFAKDDALIEVLGELDELVATLGLVHLYEPHWEVRAELRELQDHLLSACQWLAAVASGKDPDSAELKDFLEEITRRCQRLEAELSPEPRPVLPGEHMSATYLDYARTVARRCERRAARLKRAGDVDPGVLLPLLNRVSDYLWLMARRAELHPP